MHSMKKTQSISLVLAVCLALVAIQCRAEQSNKDIEEQQVISSSPRMATKLLSLPTSSLSRFFFYHTRPNEHQATNGPVGGYKRSSSALDALTGVTLGKRSAPLEVVNYEPVRYPLRSPARMYDLHWAPVEPLDGQMDYNQ